MKTKLAVAIALIIASLTSIFAQQKDGCGCFIDVEHNQIVVPYEKDGVTIQFFDFNGKFMSQVVYLDFEELKSDFFQSKNENYTVIIFDWARLGNFGEHNNWKTIVNNYNGKTYIGNWLDNTRNYDAEKIKISNIKTSCFHPSCNPKEWVFTIAVSLIKK